MVDKNKLENKLIICNGKDEDVDIEKYEEITPIQIKKERRNRSDFLL